MEVSISRSGLVEWVRGLDREDDNIGDNEQEDDGFGNSDSQSDHRNRTYG